MPRVWLGLLALATVMIFPQWALGAGAPIDDVWMRHGGGRPYYDSIMEPRQMDMNGMRRRDPALIRVLPPITQEKAPVRRSSSKSAMSTKAAQGQAVTPKSGMPPAGQATTAKPSAPAASAAPVQKGAPVSAKPGAASPAAQTTSDGLPPATRNGSIARPEDKDHVFMAPPPASMPNAPAGAAAAAGAAASTTAGGAGGSMQGAGTTTREGQATPRTALPPGARP